MVRPDNCFHNFIPFQNTGPLGPMQSKIIQKLNGINQKTRNAKILENCVDTKISEGPQPYT